MSGEMRFATELEMTVAATLEHYNGDTAATTQEVLEAITHAGWTLTKNDKPALSDGQKQTVELVAYQLAGAASVPFMQAHPDFVMPTQEIKEAVDSALATFGIDPSEEWPEIGDALERLAQRQHAAAIRLTETAAILRGEHDGLGTYPWAQDGQE